MCEGRRGRSLFRRLLVAVALAHAAIGAAPAAAADVLSQDGTILANIRIEPAQADVSRTINLQGDVPLASYVIARQHSTNLLLQRNNLGFWVPWNGDPSTLIDNRFVAQGGALTFKLLKEDLSAALFPLTVILAYRTASGLKYGQFEIEPRP